MTIAIFGDSFSDPEKNEPHYFNGETADSWYDILKNKTGEMVLNFSISGVGPYTLFENFYDEFENNHSNFIKLFLFFHANIDCRLIWVTLKMDFRINLL